MITSTDLVQEYQRIVTEPIKGDVEESVALLHRTDWVKIMIVRNLQTPEICSIEVELSLPPCIIEPSINDTDAHDIIAHKFIEDTISHLEYLLKLGDAGLTLGILSEEGIWCASLEVQTCPDESFFETLMPPS
jgi:hypothetical protein